MSLKLASMADVAAAKYSSGSISIFLTLTLMSLLSSICKKAFTVVMPSLKRGSNSGLISRFSVKITCMPRTTASIDSEFDNTINRTFSCSVIVLLAAMPAPMPLILARFSVNKGRLFNETSII